MKIKYTLAALTLLLTSLVFGQVTFESNLPFGNRYLGFDNSSGIDLPLENNGVRTLYSFENWPGYNNRPAINNVNRIFLPLDPSIIQADVFSILQLGEELDNDLQREWMNTGITIGAEGNDILWTGIIPDPDNDASQIGGDAAIAWGDNQAGQFGPDNFRFLFISDLTSAATGPGADQGLETMRITPQGNIGMGAIFSNAQQPQNRLDVHDDDDSPQFRLTHTYNSLFTEFQESPDGNLHISPQGGVVNAVAIGFLDNQQSDPIVIGGTPTTLDVGGLTRIRNLSNLGANDCLVIGLQAAADAPEDNFLKRLDFTGDNSDFLSGDGTWEQVTAEDCRWTDQTSVTVQDEKDIYTGFLNGDGSCDRGKVGIGINLVRRAKLEVENRITRDSVDTGIYGGVDLQNTSPGSLPRIIAGVYGEVSNGIAPTTTITGVYGESNRGRYQVGVFGKTEGVQNVTGTAIGVAGYAASPSSTSPIGVYGETDGTGIGGLFFGGVSSTGTPVIISDESVKTDIAAIENANETLMQLNPKSYTFISPENREIPFDEGTRFGFLAQEVQSVLPQLVETVALPERSDSTGFIEGTNVNLLGIKYTELIPILVAGFQEQNTLLTDQATMLTEQEQENEGLEAHVAALSEQLDEQAAQIAEMKTQMTQVMASFQATQSKMNNCCGTTPSEKYRPEPGDRLRSPSGDVLLEQNFPNPFEEVTTINFSINEPAQIRLEISDSQGRVLDVLIYARMEKGEYTKQWDGSAVTPGTYYYTLYADMELLTKKMIKK